MMMKEKPKRKKWGMKRKISLLLLVMQVVSSIPNLNLMIQVMANPNPGEVAAWTGDYEDVEVPEEAPLDSLREDSLEEDVVTTVAEPFVEADLSGNESFAVSAPMEMEVPAFEPAVVSDEVIYDEIIEEDVVFSSGTTISNKKIWYKGNVTINDNIYFRDSEIRISGTLLIQKGRTSVSVSTLQVDGDLRIQLRGDNDSYLDSAGDIYFNGDSKVVVYGDLYTQSARAYSGGTIYGTYELHGNFYQIGDTYFRVKNMVFLGEGEQHVSFDQTNRAYLSNLLVKNEQGKLYLDTPVPYMELGGDVVLAGRDVEVGQLITKGYNVKIEGDFLINETSNLTSTDGSTILIDGNLRIQSKLGDGEYGAARRGLGGSHKGKIMVTGDFYTQCTDSYNFIPGGATLEVEGNFHHIEDTWFNMEPTAGILVFTGEGEQHISFSPLLKAKASLGKVMVNNEQGKLYIDTLIPGIDLMHNTILKGDDVELAGFNNNGYDMKIEGSFLIHEKTLSTVYLNNTTLYIEGDLRIQSKNEEGNYSATNGYIRIAGGGRVVVKGDFYTESTNAYNSVSGGNALELHGNAYYIGDSKFNVTYQANFGSLIFAGEGEQRISMEEPDKINLIHLVQTKTCSAIVIDAPYVNGITPGSDLVLGGNLILNKIDVNDHTIRFQGFVEFTVPSFHAAYIKRGSLIFDQDLTLRKDAAIFSYGSIIIAKGDVYLEDYGRIALTDENDLMIIEGNLYNHAKAYNGGYPITVSKGCLDIKGDYIQSTGSFIHMKKEAMVQFSSPHHQKISIPEGMKFNFLNIGLDPGMNYTFSPGVTWTNLYPAYDTSDVARDVAAQYFGQPGTNAATGNYSQSFSDLTVQSVIGSLDITHSYNSLSREDGILGTGFVFSQNMKMLSSEVMGNEHKTVILPDGARQTFIGKPDGFFTAEDSRGDLIKAGDHYILTTMDQAKFTFDEGGTLLTLEDRIGNKLTYEVNGDGNITSIQDITGTSISMRYEGRRLEEISNQLTGERAFFVYAEDRLHKSIDTIGNMTSYEYDSDGLLTKIINNDGSVFEEISYIPEGSQKGKVHTITNKAGNVDTYSYDNIFRKTTITDSNGRQTIKEYDFSSRIISSIDELGKRSFVNYVITDGRNKYGDIASETDVYGNITSYTRDAKGRVTNVVHPDGSNELTTYDKKGNIVKSVDKNGAATYFIFDADGKNLLKKVQPLDGVMAYSETADQELFAITTYTYDMAHGVKGLVATETGPLGDDANYIRNEHNQKGQAVKKTTVINGIPYTTSYTYNEKNLPTREVAPDGVVTEYSYNQRTEVIRKKLISGDESQETVERVVYDNMGQKIKTISPLEYDAGKDDIVADTYSGVGTTLTYDAAGNVLTTTDALGNQVKNTYDLYGNLLTQTFPNGSYSQYTYDMLNRQVTEEFYDHTTSELKLLKKTSYIQSGRNLQTSTTMYLEENRSMKMIEITDYAGRVLNATNAEGNTIRKTYTKGGAVATETDVYGKITSYVYDKRGNLLSQSAPFEGSSFAETEYTYNKVGKPLSEIVYNNRVGDSASSTHKTLFEYDAWGNTTKVVQYDGDKASNHLQTFYDFKGQAVRQYTGLSSPLVIHGLDDITTGDDEEFNVTQYEYNYLGKPIQVKNALGDIETTSYDVSGNMTSSVDYTGGIYTITYDSLGRTLTEEITATEKETIYKEFSYDNMGKIIYMEENGIEHTLQYNGKGELIEEQAGAVRKEYSYDGAGMVLISRIYEDGELLKETCNTYDKMGRPVTVSDGNVLKATYIYDKGSRLLTTKYSNGLTENNTYNDAGLPKLIANKDALGKVLSQYSYTYAVDGNQLSKMDIGGMVAYEYDGLNRLTEEKHTIGSEISTVTYKYDENSNMLAKETISPGAAAFEYYTYNKLDQLLSQTGTKDRMVYKYDKNGNMLTKETNGKIEVQEYDALNRLISWTDGEIDASYTYRIDGKRGTKTVDGIVTEHIWIGDRIQLDIQNGEVINYVHGFRLIESDYGTYLYNAHSDVVQVVKDGSIVSRYDYNAYGQRIGEYAEDENDQNPFRYSGEYQDMETGYIYLRARYYDPDIARFINQDPIRSGANWNIYAGANPVMNRDPSGLFFEKVWAGAKKAGSAVASAATKAGKAVGKFVSSDAGKKVLLGVAIIAVIAVVAVAVVATGGAAAGLAGAIAVGALKGAVIGAVVGAAAGAAVGATVHRASTGSWEGAGEAAADGAANGFLIGTASGAVTGGGVGYLKGMAEAAALAAPPLIDQVSKMADGDAKVKDAMSQLTRAQYRNVNKLSNIIENNLTDGDFSGTLADLEGNPIPNLQRGDYWDHLTEMKQSYAGLQDVKNGLEGSLKNPNLNPTVRAFIESELGKTYGYIKKIEDLFKPFGGIQ